jgi:hypothetical protein
LGYIVVIAAAAAAGAIGVLALTGGDDDEPGAPGTTAAPAPTATVEEPETTPSEAENEMGGTSEEERQVERVVRTYIEALNVRDGRRVCELVPGVSEELDLPVQRPSCEASVRASIGYRDPRGFPVWKSSEVSRVRSIVVEGSSARVSATVITLFADRGEPSIEDDTIYLRERRHRWRLAKPSATIYRAVGYPDVPPEVLQPPP